MHNLLKLLANLSAINILNIVKDIEQKIDINKFISTEVINNQGNVS